MTEQELNYIIGQNIKYYRALYNLDKSSVQKLTQEKLAEKTELSTSLIGGLESEKTTHGISLFSLYKISKILGVSVDKLLEKRD